MSAPRSAIPAGPGRRAEPAVPVHGRLARMCQCQEPGRRLIHRRMHREPKECGATAAARPQTSGTGSGCCDPAPSQHDATLLVHCMHGRRQMTATRRPVMGSVVTIGSVRVIHPLSQRGSGQGINLACLGSLHLSSRRVGDLDLAPIS